MPPGIIATPDRRASQLDLHHLLVPNLREALDLTILDLEDCRSAPLRIIATWLNSHVGLAFEMPACCISQEDMAIIRPSLFKALDGEVVDGSHDMCVGFRIVHGCFAAWKRAGGEESGVFSAEVLDGVASSVLGRSICDGLSISAVCEFALR